MTTVTTVPGDLPSGVLYNRAFWLAYSANLLLVTANALTFRFAEFVQYLRGTESLTGQIVQAGLVGSLVVRLVLGQAIDGLGVRRIWIASSVVFIAGCVLFVLIDRLGPALFVARVLFTAGIASMFACSIYHVQIQAPPHRRTEVIGSLGTSGFVGMVAGTQIGDLLFRAVADPHALFVMLFALTAILGTAYLAIVVYLTRNDGLPCPVLGPPVHQLIFRYWPGAVAVVALLMGVGFTVTTVFLTRYATEHGLGGIGTFFACYAAAAFVFRWVSRSWSQSMGRHRMLLLGLGGHTVGHLLLVNVSAQWEFVLPALCTGFGHALLFPCVVSLGAGAFPPEFRGTGTSIILACVDLGTMLSAPVLGSVIERHGFNAMYYATAGLMAAGFVAYGALKFRAGDEEANTLAASPVVAGRPDLVASDVE